MNVFRAGIVASGFAVSLVGCAVPPPGTPEHDTIQKTVDSIGIALGGTKKDSSNPNPNVGAAEVTQSGKMVAINSINIMIEAPHPSDPRWQGKQISETPLFHFFEQHPISRPGEYWPRVGIQIDDFSETLLNNDGIERIKYIKQLPNSQQPNIARPTECIKFTAVIWTSEKKSQRIDNVVLCSTDIKLTDGYMTWGALRNYKNLMAPISISSEQVRTLGPRVPSQLLPTSDSNDSTMYFKAQHLFSTLFNLLKYSGPVDNDQRLWFVNLTKKVK